MKKLYTLLMAAIVAISASAQGTNEEEPQAWTKTISALDNQAKPTYTAPVLTTLDNGVVVAGRFNQDITFGATTISTELTSTYVAKYDATGKEQWIKHVEGAATIKFIVEDADANLIIAGVFADKIKLGTFELNGATGMWGDPIADQNSVFIAAIDVNGNFTAAKAYNPTYNEDMLSNPSFSYYETYFSDPRLDIASLCVQGNNVYAACLIKGQITLGGETIKGGIMNLYDFYLDDNNNAFVFSTDKSLSYETLQAKIIATDVPALSAQTTSLKICAFNNNLYIAAAAQGQQTLTTVNGQTQTFDLKLEDGATPEMGIIVANISPEKLIAQVYKETTDASIPYVVSGIICGDGESVVIGGTFRDVNPFADQFQAKGLTDLYLARISNINSDRWGVQVKASDYAEGASNKISEEPATLAYDGTNYIQWGYVLDYEQNNSGVTTMAHALLSDFDQINGTFVCEDGLITASSKYAYALYNLDGTNGYNQTVLFGQPKIKPITDAIAAPNATTATAATTIYDLQGRRATTATPGLYIINGKKAIIK